MENSLGSRMKERRIDMGLSQETLAQLTGVSKWTVINWEADKRTPNAQKIFIIAEALGTTPQYLLGKTEDIGDYGEYPIGSNNQRSETTEMFAKLMKMLAAENPDLIIHFRDLEKNLDKLSPRDIQAIADGFALLTGKANKDIEKRFRKAGPGDI